MQNKRAISVMIGYVLLISFGIILGALVYQGMKTYIPKDPLVCPDGVSVLIKDVSCTKDDFGHVSLDYKIKNNGRFNVSGYFIRVTNNSEQEFATVDLSKYIWQNIGGIRLSNSVGFGSDVNYNLKPNSEIKTSFLWDLSEVGAIYSIEMTPTRFQKTEEAIEFVSCTNSKIKEEVTCV